MTEIYDLFYFNRYQLMMDCWEHDPDERPTFAQLISTFEKMMTVDAPYYEFNQLDEREPCYSSAAERTSKTVEQETGLETKL